MYEGKLTQGGVIVHTDKVRKRDKYDNGEN